MDHAGDKAFMLTDIGADHTNEMEEDKRVDEVLQKRVNGFGGSVESVQHAECGDVVKGEDKTGECHRRKYAVEEDVDGLNGYIMTIFNLFDRDDRPEGVCLPETVIQPLLSWFGTVDNPAADEQDAKAIADQPVDIPKLVVEFMRDGPGLVGADGYAFLLQLSFDQGDGIAGPENGGGEQDDGDGGGYKKDKGPMPKADCLRVRFQERMGVHMAVVNRGLGRFG